MRENYLHFWRINRHVIRIHWVRIFQPYFYTSLQSGLHTCLPGMEKGNATFFLRLPHKAVRRPVIGIKLLRRRVEFESFDPEILINLRTLR